MESESPLFKLPLELRQHIYSHLLIHNSVTNITSTLNGKPLRDGFARSCRQLYHETREYYYANNTFLMQLNSHLEARPRILQHLVHVQHLQVELGDLAFSPADRQFVLDGYTQQGWNWFLDVLWQAKRGQPGQRGVFFKTLAAVDRCGTSIVSQ